MGKHGKGAATAVAQEGCPPESAVDRWLEERIRARTARVAVVGLGYVGLPLAVEFARSGFAVTGIEENPKREAMAGRGENYILPGDRALAEVVEAGRLSATHDYDLLPGCDVVCICVPTPLTKHREPNITYIQRVTSELSRRLRRGMLVVLESTSYPGTTEEVMLPKLETSGLKVGDDFFLAFSPERIDPGNTLYTTRNTPKVVGGVTPRCTRVATLLYEQVVEKVHAASSPRVAEMEKLLENVFRSVNIALVNELAILCREMRIDVWEVIRLASTKPYGFMPFYPGPGLGGHCIPIDPFYLTWKAREYDLSTRFIELAGEINSRMPYLVVGLVAEALGSQRKSLHGASVLVLGVAYKRDVADWRTSPSLKVMEILRRKGAQVSYNDPHVPEIAFAGKPLASTDPARVGEFDCVVICTDHSAYDMEAIVKNARLIVDTRDATKIRGNPNVWVL